MALTKTITGAVNQIMAVDGTAAIKDAIHNAAFTMTGTPTTAALLGSTAPVISAAAYTSMSISTATIGLTAGQPLTMMFVVNTPWDGTGMVAQRLFNWSGLSTNSLTIGGVAPGTLYAYLLDAASDVHLAGIALDASNWAANTNHIVILTLATDNTMKLYLDGVSATGAGVGVRETSLPATVSIGNTAGGGAELNGAILSAIWGRVLTSAEITALSSPASWASVIDLPQITVTGLATGNAVRLYDSAGNVHASAVESGGTATLTYALD